MSDTNRPNVGNGLLAIHRVLTRGLEITIQYSGTFASAGFPDPQTREGFLLYARNFVDVLHAHHLTEDELAWPGFREKIPDAPYDALIAQHRQMDSLLAEMSAALAWLDSGEVESRALSRFNRAARGVQDLWHKHIHAEESLFGPAQVVSVFTPAEHIAMQQAFTRHLSEHAGPPETAVAFVLYNLSPADRAVISAGMPRELTEQLVPVVWKSRWSPMKPFLLD